MSIESVHAEWGEGCTDIVNLVAFRNGNGDDKGDVGEEGGVESEAHHFDCVGVI